MKAPRRLLPALALAAVAALPLVAERVRTGGETCAFDGVAVHAAYRARVMGADGVARSFCGVRCAEAWLAREGGAPARVFVTDCASGREVDAEGATYLRSVATWQDGAPDTVRVFAQREDAERHARAYGGVVLRGEERPFRVAARD